MVFQGAQREGQPSAGERLGGGSSGTLLNESRLTSLALLPFTTTSNMSPATLVPLKEYE